MEPLDEDGQHGAMMELMELVQVCSCPHTRERARCLSSG